MTASPEPETVAGRTPTVRRLVRLVDGFIPEGMSASQLLDFERAVETVAAEARSAAVAPLVKAVEPDLRLVIRQLREEGYADWPDILDRVLALLSAPPVREPDAGGLDVDRLARALHACEHPAVGDCRLGLNMRPRPEWAGRRKCEVDAERLAAEYARLAPSVPPDREP